MTTEKKRVNSKNKGANNERALCKLLAKELAPFKFIRSQASGAIIGGKNFETNAHLYSQEAMHFFVSDIVCSNEQEINQKFRFCIEAKHYKEADKLELLLNGKSNIYKWIEQATTDGNKVNKPSLVIFKYNNTPFYVAAPQNIELPVDRILILPTGHQLCYLEDLLKEKDFWISKLDMNS
jgi:hypothetical protein